MELQKTASNQISKKLSPEFGIRLAQAIASSSPVAIVKLEYALTIQDTIHGQTLRQLEKQLSTDDVASLLTLLILKTAQFFNLGKSISEDQALETAYLLMGTYPHETIEDFVWVFKQAKIGKYGELYNRLDGQVISGWIAKHLEQKAEIRERMHQNQKQNGAQQDKEVQLLLEASTAGKSVIDALKTAIDYEGMEAEKQKELKFQSIKLEYIKKKILENEKT